MVKKTKKAAAKKRPPPVSEPIVSAADAPRLVTFEEFNAVVGELNAAIEQLKGRLNYLEGRDRELLYGPRVNARPLLTL